MEQFNILEVARSIFTAQPFSQFLGAELVEISEIRTVIQVTLR